MAIVLNPRANYSIKILDQKDNLLWQRADFASQEEVDAFCSQYAVSKENLFWLLGTVVPLRTGNCKNFLKDFFLPIFVNSALKTSNIALKIFNSFFSIALDLIMFPIRLFTVLPRIYYNCKHPEEDHPLIGLIRENSPAYSGEDLVVRVHCEADTISIREAEGPPRQVPPSRFIFARSPRADKTVHQRIMPVALQRIWGGVSEGPSETISSIFYTHTGIGWVASGSRNFCSTSK